MTNINDMLLFGKVAELKSFSGVAEALQISRSLVSKRINRLEDRLGVQLIHRTTRRLDLTEAGKTLYQYCKQIENTWLEAETVVGEIRRKPRGRLRINAPVSFGQLELPPVIATFLQQYPDVTVDLSLSDTFVDLIEGGYDLAIRIGDLPDSSMKARKVGSTRLLVFAHQRYLKKHGIPKTPQDLRQHNCLVYRHMRGGPNEWRFNGPPGAEVVNVTGNFVAANGVPLYKAAQLGIGIVLQPEFIQKSGNNTGMVKLLEEHCREIGIYAVYPPTRKAPVNTRLFIDTLTKVLS